jgi:hypothetical protein
MTQLDSQYPLGSGLSATQLEIIYSRKDLTIDQRFAEFHKANPHIYRKLVNLAREVKGAGHTHCSIDFLMHRLRWYHHVELKSTEPFKLNDQFSSRYARAIMLMEPDLCDFFQVRKLRSKGSAK